MIRSTIRSHSSRSRAAAQPNASCRRYRLAVAAGNEKTHCNCENNRPRRPARRHSTRSIFDVEVAKMRTLVLVIVAIVVTVYILLGGLLFSLLEGDDEIKLQEATSTAMHQFLKWNSCVNRTDLHRIIDTVMKAKSKGGTYTGNGTVSFNNWNFLSATMFATTVVSTIGYGSITPITDTGRAVCVIYAIIGIPICLILLSGLGEAMTELMKSIIYKRLGCETTKGKAVAVVAYTALGFVSFLLIPSAVFAPTQAWTYGEALYFSFISLSTIGFGDFVLSAEDWRTMRFFQPFWLLLGLAWLSSVISMLSDLMLEKTSATVEKHIGMEKPGEKELTPDADDRALTPTPDAE